MIAKIKSYIELTKPRLSSLAIFSGLAGYLIARDPNKSITQDHMVEMLKLTLVLTLIGAASNVANQAMEWRLDSKMPRTQNRPIPEGRVTSRSAWIFSLTMLALGMLCLQVWWVEKEDLAMKLVLLATFVSYIAFYTPMKTRTPFNTIAGAFPGAFPILAGWLANTNHIMLEKQEGLIIFGMIFIWQLPHFFSIAWIYRDDYMKGGYRMISLYDESGKQAVALIFAGTMAMMGFALMPFFAKMVNEWYLFGTCVLNAYLLVSSALLFKDRKRFMKTYFYASIIYLPLLLSLLIFCLESN